MAIDDVYDEHEQSERVIAWLRRNGAALVAGVALGLGAIWGWNVWQARQASQGVALADTYQKALAAIEAGAPDAARRVSALPADSAYRTLASLRLAGAQVTAGKRDEALATLKAIGGTDPALKAVIDARIARLLIDAGKPKDALARLDGATGQAAAEIRGDAHLALGQAAQARQAYTEALRAADVASPSRRVLELKLTEAGGVPPTTEAKS